MDKQTIELLQNMLNARSLVAKKYGNKAEMDMLNAERGILDSAVVTPKKTVRLTRLRE